MKRASVSFLAIITLVGLVFGGFLISSPNKTANPGTVDTDVLFRQSSPIEGNANAPITITVFSDYLCPYCKDAHQVLKDILAQNGDNVKIFYRNLIVHDEANIMARAALSANNQGKFAEFDSALFETEVESTEDAMMKIASDLGLNIDTFRSDLGSKKIADIISQDDEDAISLQVRGTPTIFLDDQLVDDFRSLPGLIKDRG